MLPLRRLVSPIILDVPLLLSVTPFFVLSNGYAALAHLASTGTAVIVSSAGRTIFALRRSVAIMVRHEELLHAVLDACSHLQKAASALEALNGVVWFISAAD